MSKSIDVPKRRRLDVCPNIECQKLLQMGGHDEHVNAGGSVFCCGKLPEPVEEMFGTVLHVNDYSFCIHTPEKGMVSYKLNANDALIMETLMGSILKDYREGIDNSRGKVYGGV